MEPLEKKTCCTKEAVAEGACPRDGKLVRYLVLLAPALVVWWLVYGMLPGFSRLLTYEVLGIDRGSHLGDSVEFLLYDTPKVLMLLTLVVFGVGVIRTFFTPERTRRVLAGKRESAGNVPDDSQPGLSRGFSSRGICADQPAGGLFCAGRRGGGVFWAAELPEGRNCFCRPYHNRQPTLCA